MRLIDHRKIDKKVVYKTFAKTFKIVGDLALPLHIILHFHILISVADELCKSYYTYYKEKISRFESKERTFDDGNLDVGMGDSSKTHVSENEIIECLSTSVGVLEADIYPIKQPNMVRVERRANFAKWKEPLQLQHCAELIKFLM